MPAPVIRTRRFDWWWRGTAAPVCVDEAGEGPAVLLLPALSSISTRAEMHGLMAGLAARWRVVATDWPGFGDGPRPAVGWTPDALTAFLAEFAQAGGPWHGTVAAGHAASYAVHAAAHRGCALGRLALVAPTWRGPLPTVTGRSPAAFRAIRRAIGWPVLGQALYRLNVSRPVVRMMVREHVYTAAAPGALMAGKRRVMDAPGARFGSAAFVTGGLDRFAGREEWLAAAGRCGATLVVFGGQTPRRSLAEMEALAGVPGVESVRLPCGKLAVHEEFAADVLAPVSAFLAR